MAILDAQTEAVGSELNASVVIIGAGAAGITLARELPSSVGSILLIESGSKDMQGAVQALYEGENLGLPYFNLAACRLRYFGGTTNHWGGYCRANDAVDYEKRPEAGLPGWPITRDDLAPYVAKAASSLSIQEEFFDPAKLLETIEVDTDQLAENHSEILRTKVFQIAQKRKLGPLNRDLLAEKSNVTVVENLNAIKINLSSDDGVAESIECRTLSGKNVRVTGQRFILCCHAIENARLLMASNDVLPDGIGNASGELGRNFMDHIYVRASKFYPTAKFPAMYDRAFLIRHHMNANIGLSDDYLRQHGMMQYYMRFDPHWLSRSEETSLRRIVAGFFRPGSLSYLRDLFTVLGNLGGALQLGASRTGLATPLPEYFDLEHRIEQAPNKASRVVLSERRDALGSQIADLDWQINEFDLKTLRLGQQAMSRELSALGYGRMEIEDIDEAMLASRIVGHFHNCGTTKMSSDPSAGVVDADCRVHGVENLYVQGSSVFPSAGYSGPTMMLIALAYRLADHLANGVRT